MLKDDEIKRMSEINYTPIEYHQQTPIQSTVIQPTFIQQTPIQSYEPYTYYYAHNPEPIEQVIYQNVHSTDNVIYRYDHPIQNSLVYF